MLQSGGCVAVRLDCADALLFGCCMARSFNNIIPYFWQARCRPPFWEGPRAGHSGFVMTECSPIRLEGDEECDCPTNVMFRLAEDLDKQFNLMEA